MLWHHHCCNIVLWILSQYPKYSKPNSVNCMRLTDKFCKHHAVLLSPKYKIPYFKIYIVADQQNWATVGYEIEYVNTQSLQNLIKLD